MKNKLLLSFSIFLFVSQCFAQTTFQRIYRANAAAGAQAVQETSDGGYIAAGFTRAAVTNTSELYLVKTDKAGSTLWTKSYTGTYDNIAYAVKQTTDGGYIVAGSIGNVQQDGDLYIIKTNSTGDTTWTKSYIGLNGSVAYSIQLTNDGGYIIGGTALNFGAGTPDIYLLKIDASGNRTWTKKYGSGGDNEGNCVKQTSDNGYIVCGVTTAFGAGNGDVYLLKTDASGDTLWTRTYGSNGTDAGYAVEQTNDGGYIVTGYTNGFGAGGYDVYLIKTTATGDTLWTKTYGGAMTDWGYDVHQTSDNGYIVAGYTSSSGAGANDVYLIKTNSTGDTLWTKTYGGPSDDYGYAVELTSDGGYIIAGNTFNYNPPSVQNSVYLVKTDASGNTGCHQGSSHTIVGRPATKVSSARFPVSSGGVPGTTVTAVSSAGSDTTLCLYVGFEELSMDNNISVYPNPAGNESTVYGLQFMHHATLTIYNMTGQVLKKETRTWKTEETIDVSALPSGIYFLRVEDDTQSRVGKFIKE